MSEERRRRVLIVDDDRAVLASLAEMVRACGHDAIATTSWNEALRLARTRAPDLILLDVMMPQIDGFKLARMLKADAATFVPIILLTALDDIETKRRAMAAGADDFLSKPISRLELEIRLSSMLRIKELTRKLEHANARLEELAVTDSLTGLANRRSLGSHLEREWARSQRYGHPFSVVMIDVDHFKQINDTRGHAVGDEVLIAIAKTLAAVVRETDVVGRWGGEEFLVIAPETSSPRAGVLAERIRVRVAGATLDAADLPDVTVSLGIASTESSGLERVEDLLERADTALYAAKADGRDRVVASD